MKKDKIQNMEQILTTLLGKQSFRPIRTACRGKWRGTYDYSLQFEDGSRYFISNGKANYADNLTKAISEYSYFYANKTKLEALMQQVVDRDNQQAITLGLEPVIFHRLRILNENTDHYRFHICADMEQAGEKLIHISNLVNWSCRTLDGQSSLESQIERSDEDIKSFNCSDNDEFIAILTGILYTRKNIDWMHRVTATV